MTPLFLAAAGFLGLLFAGAPVLAAQAVLGRVVRETDGAPVLEALIILLDDRGRERARTVSSPTGGFELRAPAAGLYRVRVQRIGDRGWETPPFHLAAGQFSRPTLRVPDRPFELRELRALARRPRCGMTLGDASVGATLLGAAQTALGLAEAEATKGRRRYVTETYRRTVPEDGPPRDTVVSRGELAGWPIQSADPDSLRIKGFVQGQWPAPNVVTEGPLLGPTYYGPDASVLFTDWFLGTHCILIDTTAGRSDGGTRLVARFEPAKGTRSAAALFGSLEFDRATLALRSLHFQFAARPSWAPRGSGGGELRFARLSDGAWVPVSWDMRAPVPRQANDRLRYRFFGVVETGGRVTAVRGPDGQPDLQAEAALTEAK